MWQRPQLMTAIADLLLISGAAALTVTVGVWFTRLPTFVLQEVSFSTPLHEVKREDLERALAGQLRGNFFSINVDALRLVLEQVPWVRRAEVRRQWPSRLEVRLEEHQAAALWGEAPPQLVNRQGEVFAALPPAGHNLPLLHGPHGSSAEVLQFFGEVQRVLAPVGDQPVTLLQTPRQAWQIRLESGVQLELGRAHPPEMLVERMHRFARWYPELKKIRKDTPQAVDMRYPSGFAVRYAAAVDAVAGGKGK